MTLTFLLVMSLSFAACDGEDCISGVGAQGIKLGTRDSVSGLVLDEQVTVTVVRLDRKLAPFQPDSLRGGIGAQNPDNPLRLADTYGTYRLTVEAPGYQTWDTRGDRRARLRESQHRGDHRPTATRVVSGQVRPSTLPDT